MKRESLSPLIPLDELKKVVAELIVRPKPPQTQKPAPKKPAA